MAKYKIGLQRTDWLTVEAESFTGAILVAKEKVAEHDYSNPHCYEYIGGHRIPDDYE